jgi:hypothetical protein
VRNPTVQNQTFGGINHDINKTYQKFHRGGIILISLATVSSAQAINLLQNGSFENTAGTFVDNGQGAMSLNSGSTAIPGWTTTNAELAWLNNNNIFGVTSPFGNFFLELAGYHDSSPYGGVTQAINTTVGQKYTLSLSLGTRNPTHPGPISVTATAGSSNQTFTSNPSGAGNQWENFSFDFTATGTSTPISIVGISTANRYHIGLDNVSVEAVPEPLTILGSATALGFGAFFKRKLAQGKKSNQGISI